MAFYLVESFGGYVRVNFCCLAVCMSKQTLDISQVCTCFEQMRVANKCRNVCTVTRFLMFVLLPVKKLYLTIEFKFNNPFPPVQFFY